MKNYARLGSPHYLVICVVALALSLIGFSTFASAALDPNLLVITGGRGVGSVKLGQNMATIKSILGQPKKTVASPNDPNSKLMYYPLYGLDVFMGSGGSVVGITVTGKKYHTAQGIKIGSSMAAVKKAYGNGLQRGRGNITYPNRGLAFSSRNGLVSTIYVVKIEDDRAMLGDRIIVPGSRVGDIRIGLAASLVARAWGDPDSVSNISGQNSQLCMYKEEGVGLIVSRNYIIGMVINTGDFITKEGVKVGSSKNEVLKAFGKGYTADKGDIIYESKGISFSFANNRVHQITVIKVGR